VPSNYFIEKKAKRFSFAEFYPFVPSNFQEKKEKEKEKEKVKEKILNFKLHIQAYLVRSCKYITFFFLQLQNFLLNLSHAVCKTSWILVSRIIN
jgi:hypothetical protein